MSQNRLNTLEEYNSQLNKLNTLLMSEVISVVQFKREKAKIEYKINQLSK